MKAYLVFPFFILCFLLRGTAPAAIDARVPAVPASAPCDSLSDSPFVGQMLLFAVSVEGGGNTANVSANDSFTVSIDYYIQVCDSPAANNFCQVVVGYADAAAPQFCIFRSRVDCNGQIGSLSFRMKAPAFPVHVARSLGRPRSWPARRPAAGESGLGSHRQVGRLSPARSRNGQQRHRRLRHAQRNHPPPARHDGAISYGVNPRFPESQRRRPRFCSGPRRSRCRAPHRPHTGHTWYYYRATARVKRLQRRRGSVLLTGPLFVGDAHLFGHSSTGSRPTASRYRTMGT